MMVSIFKWFALLLFLAIFLGCKEDYSPKPRGYFRIGFPKKEYQELQGGYPYSFDYPLYASIKPYKGQWKDSDTAAFWLNVEFPQFKSRIYLTYKKVNSSLANLIEDAHSYAFKHSVKADAILQSEYAESSKRVFSVLFDIKGNTASALQFYATDSLTHFLRGALYFDCQPNKDSLAPVVEFLRLDLIRMIESISWRKP